MVKPLHLLTSDSGMQVDRSYLEEDEGEGEEDGEKKKRRGKKKEEGG